MSHVLYNRRDLARGRGAPWQSQVSGAGGQETPNPEDVTERQIADALRAGSGFRKEAVGAAGQSWALPPTWLPPAAQAEPGMGRPLVARLGAAGLRRQQETGQAGREPGRSQTTFPAAFQPAVFSFRFSLAM